MPKGKRHSNRKRSSTKKVSVRRPSLNKGKRHHAASAGITTRQAIQRVTGGNYRKNYGRFHRPVTEVLQHVNWRGSSSKQEIKDLYHSIMLPGTGPRPPVVNCAKAAATAGTTTTFDLNFTTQNADSGFLLPAGATFLVLRRDPIWGYIYYDANSTNQKFTYNAQFSTTASNTGPNASFKSSGSAINVEMDYPLSVSCWISPSGYQPHGQNYYAAGFANKTWNWFDGTTTNPFQVNYQWADTSAGGQLANTDYNVTLEVWRMDGNGGPRVYKSDQTAWNGGGTLATGSTTVDIRGYFAFQFKIVCTGAVNAYKIGKGYCTYLQVVTTNNTNACDVCCHRMAPGLDTGIGTLSEVRTIGTAILGHCNAAKQFRNGDVIVATLAPEKQWFDFISQSNVMGTIAITSGVRDYKVFGWDNGAYAYLKPEEQMTSFNALTKFSGGNMGNPLSNDYVTNFYPWPAQDCLLMYVITQTPSTTPSSIGRFTIGCSLQYQPNSILVPVDRTKIRTTDLQDVFDQMSGADQYFENPLHLAAIGKLIMNAVRVGGVIADTVSSIAGAVKSVKGALS